MSSVFQPLLGKHITKQKYPPGDSTTFGSCKHPWMHESVGKKTVNIPKRQQDNGLRESEVPQEVSDVSPQSVIDRSTAIVYYYLT